MRCACGQGQRPSRGYPGQTRQTEGWIYSCATKIHCGIDLPERKHIALPAPGRAAALRPARSPSANTTVTAGTGLAITGGYPVCGGSGPCGTWRSIPTTGRRSCTNGWPPPWAIPAACPSSAGRRPNTGCLQSSCRQRPASRPRATAARGRVEAARPPARQPLAGLRGADLDLERIGDYALRLEKGTARRLGWVLVFKGRTALKKCYVGRYRFSEDLDFSALAGAPTGDAMEDAVRSTCREAVGLLDEYAPVAFECERYTEREPHPGGHETIATSGGG